MRIIIFLLFSILLLTSISYANPVGEIHLYCKPKVNVFLDGISVGKTNKADSGLIIKDVSIGRHSIRLMKKRKTNEVLIFIINDSLVEIESNKYEIGKFTKIERDARLIKENSEFLPSWGTHITWNSSELEERVGLYERHKSQVYDAVNSDLYIPSIDEKYKVDTLPKMIYMELPIYAIVDSNLSLEYNEVWVKGLVDPNGNVDSVVIIGSCGSTLFDKMAYDAALESVFEPAIKDNKKTWIWVAWSIPYRDIYLGKKGFGNGRESGNAIQQIYPNKPSKKTKSITSTDIYPLDVLPMIVTKEIPIFPQKLFDQGLEGTVWIKGLVSSEGDVLDAHVGVSSGYPEFDSAAVKAAYQYYFLPGERNSRPVEAVIAWDIIFDKKIQNWQIQMQLLKIYHYMMYLFL